MLFNNVCAGIVLMFSLGMCVNIHDEFKKTPREIEEAKAAKLDRVARTFIVEHDGTEDNLRRSMARNGYTVVGKVRLLIN